MSLERRQAYWQEGERANLSFAEKNQQWNGSTHRAILSLTTTPEGADQQRVAKATLARETLNHLGLTGGDATVEKTFTLQEKGEQRLALFSDIETFRTTYFEGGRSDIKGFVRKLAEQYPGTNGQVDALNLKDRLDAIRPLLGSFGDQSVDSLVEDFAISYGLLSQSEQNKAIVAREAKSQLYPPLAQGKKAVYERLGQKQREIDEVTAGGREQTLEQETQEQLQVDEPVRPEQPRVEPQVQVQPSPTQQPTPEGGASVP